MGGQGSGNFGHAGRPGEVGGSGEGGGSFHEPSASLKGTTVLKGHLSDGMIIQMENQIAGYNEMAPEAMATVKAIGERMDVIAEGYRAIEADDIALYMKDHPGSDYDDVKRQFDDAIGQKMLRAAMGSDSTPGSTMVTGNKDTLIGINSHFESEEGKAEMMAAVARNFQPKGSGTLKSVIDHEIEHVMDRTYDISGDPRFREALEKDISPPGKPTYDRTALISKRLCDYAGESVTEFAACAWDEYKNNPKPRPVARKYGKLIEKIVKDKRAYLASGGKITSSMGKLIEPLPPGVKVI